MAGKCGRIYSLSFGNKHSDDLQWLIYGHITRPIQQIKIQRQSLLKDSSFD